MKSVSLVIMGLIIGLVSIPMSGKDTADRSFPGHLKIKIPKREHGYSNFETVVIRTEKEYTAFIESINRQKGWNNKAKVVDGLNAMKKRANFKLFSLVLLRHTEGSGSVAVNLSAPERKGKTLILRVKRIEPETGTADMAYYCFGFAVYKTSFDAVEYHSKGKKQVLKLE